VTYVEIDRVICPLRRAPLIARVSTIVLSAILFGACEPTSVDRPRWTEDGPPTPLEPLADAFVRAYCEALDRGCVPPPFGVTDRWVALRAQVGGVSCEPAILASFDVRALQNGIRGVSARDRVGRYVLEKYLGVDRVRFEAGAEPEELDTCFAQLSALCIAPNDLGMASACVGVFRGDVQLGESCLDDYECAGQSYCGDLLDSSGACVGSVCMPQMPPQGKPCDQYEDSCSVAGGIGAAKCDRVWPWDASCYQYSTIRGNRAFGETCSSTVECDPSRGCDHGRCGPGLVCGQARTCVAFAALGEGCDRAALPCEDGLECRPDGTGQTVCQSPASQGTDGSQCDPALGSWDCDPLAHLVCDGDTRVCVLPDFDCRLGRVPSDCDAAEVCIGNPAIGFGFCQPPATDGSFCIEAADCASGQCLLGRCGLRTVGQSCGTSSPCSAGLSCRMHVCTTDSGLGGPCGFGKPGCEPGLECGNDGTCEVPLSEGSICGRWDGQYTAAPCADECRSFGPDAPARCYAPHSPPGTPCYSRYDCASYRCENGACAERADLGEACTSESDCLSTYCLNGACAARANVGEACSSENDCVSRRCDYPLAGGQEKECLLRLDGTGCWSDDVCISGVCSTYDRPNNTPARVCGTWPASCFVGHVPSWFGE